MIEENDPIDSAAYTICSDGILWKDSKRKNGVYESGHFADLYVESLNPDLLLESRDYVADETRIALSVYIDNIFIGYSREVGSHSYRVSIIFADHRIRDTGEDVYEVSESADEAYREQRAAKQEEAMPVIARMFDANATGHLTGDSAGIV